MTLSQPSHALVTFPRCDSDHYRYAAFDILIRGGSTGHTDSHRRVSLPLRSPTPAGPIFLDICDDPPRVLRSAERDSTWFKTTSFRMANPAWCRRSANT